MISGLADARVRRSAARWLGAACVLGFAASAAVMAGLGYGLDRWVFLVLVWAVLIYAPLRILIESSETSGARAVQALAAQLATDPYRYTHAASLPVIIRDLASREVVLPRICHPQHLRQAVDAAVALIAWGNARRDVHTAMTDIIRTLVAALAARAATLSAAVNGEANSSIQARWEGARSLGALGALIAILAAAFADRWGEPPLVPALGGRSLAAYLASALDYCDEASLQVDALPWTEPPLASSLADGTLELIGGRWQAFLDAGLPAPRALSAFVAAVAPPVV
ncbi:MAG: hypothetical protein A2Z07_13045 [Armatimonadetes bacterium RBG_16_67_12]|nr:MAG: hypothetical protein A2Z07_13045 [Armatimonadetes bacterium RBG_16_67_12]